MLEFKVPELSDKEWVKKAMLESHNMSCEYCFGNLYVWSHVYKNTIAKYKDLFVARDGNERPMYLFPCGTGDKKEVISELIKKSENDGFPLEMYCLTPEKVRELNEIMPDKFNFVTMRDYFDYIYKTDDLKNLAGRKYHSKRNHLSYFKNNFNWQYEKITNDNLQDCFDMNTKWENENSEKDPEEIKRELDAIKRAFSNYDELGFTGGLLRVDGEVVAYTMGEAICPTVFCTHFEKAFSSMRGAYPAINQQFCENELMTYTYVNREDDNGEEGLRKAKLSYNPSILLEKYRAIYKG